MNEVGNMDLMSRRTMLCDHEREKGAVSVRAVFLMRIALVAISLVAVVSLCFAVSGAVKLAALQDGFEHGFELTGTYDGGSYASFPSRASFAVKEIDGYDGLWQLSHLESDSTLQHEEGWLRATEDPNLYYLVDRGGSQVGWVAVSGLRGVFGKGHQVVVEYNSSQSRFDCTSLDPSLEGEDESVGYAGAALEELTSDQWFGDTPWRW